MIAHPPARAGETVTLRFADATGEQVTSFRVPADVPTAEGPEAAVAAGLMPAMARGEPLVVDQPVSARLATATTRLGEILATWDRALHPGAPRLSLVPLVAPVRHPDGDRPAPVPRAAAVDPGADRPAPASRAAAVDPRGPRPVARPAPASRAAVVDPRGPRPVARPAACFFTGGVDSFHSVLRHRDDLDALVFVHGFDLSDDLDAPLNRMVGERVRVAADALGLPLIEVGSDLPAFGRAFGLSWDDYHGAALAAVALLLAPRFATFHVPATTTYAELYPLGSHPLTDPLWSTEDVEIVHDGADVTRVDKLRALAEHPVARQHLRVCFENRDGRYNCGRCEKCVRTGVAVRIAGVEGAFASLPAPSLRQVAGTRVVGLGTAWKGYRDELGRTGSSPRLRAAVRLALLRHRWRTDPRVGRWIP
ncbi:MAG: hypothetical protein AB7L84_11750 [Acidimicrobiia bacterium]